MTPYVVRCKSCPAKLKVSVPELVAKDIACPKCGAALTLTPPKNWEPDTGANPDLNSAPKEDAGQTHHQNRGQQNDAEAEDDIPMTNRFDDLDDVLGGASIKTEHDSEQGHSKKTDSNTARHTTEKNKTRGGTKDGEVKTTGPKVPRPQIRAERSNKHGTPSPKPADQGALADQSGDSLPTSLAPGAFPSINESSTPISPMLPDGTWDSPELKRKKKTIRIAAFAVVGVCLVGIGAGLIFSGGAADSKIDPTVADIVPPETDLLDGDEPLTATAPSDSVENSALNTAKPTPQPSGSQSPPSIVDGASISAIESDDSVVVKGVADFAPPSIGVPQNTAAQSNSARPNSPNAASGSASDTAPPANSFAAKTNDDRPPTFDAAPEIAAAAEPKDESLAQFARALEESGTLLSDIQDTAFLQRESSLIGLPRYFIQVPKIDAVDIDRQLNLKISGLKLKQSPVLDVLFELETLSGIPVSFDWNSPSVMEANFDALMSLDEKDVSIEQLFVAVATELELEVNATQAGIVFSDGSPQQVEDRQWPLPFKLKPESIQQLAGFITERIAPETLEKEAGMNVSVTPEIVSVKHNKDVAAKVEQLIDEMAFAFGPDAAQLSADAPALVPRALRGQTVRAAPLQLGTANPFDRPYRLGSLLKSIRDTTGLNIFVDWQQLQALGWTPETEVPGKFDEPTALDALTQLARSLKVTWVVIDDNKVLLTTFQQAAQQSDIEVYPVKHLLSERFNSAQLKRVLENTLPQQLVLPTVSVVYFPECDCLVAFAPQSVQRQIFSILQQLAGDLKSGQ